MDAVYHKSVIEAVNELGEAIENTDDPVDRSLAVSSSIITIATAAITNVPPSLATHIQIALLTKRYLLDLQALIESEDKDEDENEHEPTV